jgi:hypothetical protein
MIHSPGEISVSPSSFHVTPGQPNDSSGEKWFIDATTDADGWFSCEGLTPDDRFQLWVTHPDFGIVSRTHVAAHGSETLGEPLRIELPEPCGIEIVIDDEMRASHNRLLVMLSGQMQARRWVNNEPVLEEGVPSGVFMGVTMPLEAAGPTRVSPLPAGIPISVSVATRSVGRGRQPIVLRSRVVTLTENSTERVEFKSGEGATLCGKLIDTNGRPVRASISVRVVPEDNQQFSPPNIYEPVAGARADDSGEFVITGLAAGLYLVDVQAEQSHFNPFSALASLRVRVPADAQNGHVITRDFLNLDPTRSGDSMAKADSMLNVQVVSKATGEPIAGAQVAVVPDRGGSSIHQYSDEFGDFQLNAIAASDVAISAFNPDRFLSESDSTGAARVAGLENLQVEHVVYAVHPEFGAALLTNVIPANYSSAPLRIEFETAAMLKCSLDEPAITGATVYFQLAWAPGIEELNDDQALAAVAAKHAVISTTAGYMGQNIARSRKVQTVPLPPNQPIMAIVNLMYSQKTSGTTPLREALIRLAPGETHDFSKPPDGAVVAGRASDETGKPLAYVTVTVETKDPLRRKLSAMTDVDGRYAIRGVPPGNFPISLTRYGLRTAPG